MSRKILITGSTDGIGKLAAIQLANEGHQIYLHGRSEKKLEASIHEVIQKSGSQKVKGFLADFSDLAAVKKMADEIKSQSIELDVLINNAGVFNSAVKTNKNGLDIRFVVNYLAPYVLTQELMPLLSTSIDPRIINLGSAAQSPVNFSDLKGENQLQDQPAYAQSKLALTMWTFNLAESQKEVSAVVVNPGSLLDTKMAMEAFGQIWSPAEKGSNILRDLAVSDKYQNASGQYFDNDKEGFGPAHPGAYDVDKQKELLVITEQLISSILQ